MSASSWCCRIRHQTPIRGSSGSREPYWSKGRRISRPGWAGLVINPKPLCPTTTQPTRPRRRQHGTKQYSVCSEQDSILSGSAISTTRWKGSPLNSLPRTRSTGATKSDSGCRYSVGGDFLCIRSRDTGGSSHKASWIVLRRRFALARFGCGRRWACSGPAGSATEGISSTWDPPRRGCAPLSNFQEISPVRRQPLPRPLFSCWSPSHAVTDCRYRNGGLVRGFFTISAHFGRASSRALQRGVGGARSGALVVRCCCCCQHPRWFAPAGRGFTGLAGLSGQVGSRENRVRLPGRHRSRLARRLSGFLSFRAIIASRALLLRTDLLADSGKAGGPPRSKAHRTFVCIGRATCLVSGLELSGVRSRRCALRLRKQAGSQLSARPRASLSFDFQVGFQSTVGCAAVVGRARTKVVTRGELAALLHVPGWLAGSRIRRTSLNYAPHTSNKADLVGTGARRSHRDSRRCDFGPAGMLDYRSGRHPGFPPVGRHHDAGVRAVARSRRGAVAGQRCGSLKAGYSGRLLAAFASPTHPCAHAARTGKLSEHRPLHRDEVEADPGLCAGAAGYFMAASRRPADSLPNYFEKRKRVVHRCVESSCASKRAPSTTGGHR